MKFNVKPTVSKAQRCLKETGHTLMPHQIDGVKWLLDHERGQRHTGGILADDMGLGKTIQILSVIIANPKKKTLIFVPASLINQWESEIKKFIPNIPLYIHWRDTQVGDTELEEMKSQPINIILTSYGYVTSPLAQNNIYDRIVCDEAHYFRNSKSVTFNNIQLISAPIRWALTGTAIQNYLGDLQTLLTFVGETDFGWGTPMTIEDAEEMIPKYMLRRTKEQVKIELPKPKYKTVGLSFKTKTEEEFYEKVCEDTLHKHYTVADNHLERLLRLRQSTVIPFSYAQTFEQKYKTKMDKFKTMSSTKLNYIVKKVSTTDNKSVVFCHFKMEIKYLAEKLATHRIKYGIISGDIPMDQRKEIITNESYHVLLIQINAGGTGLNLQHYKEIFISSPHWNPSVEEQAIGRLYRIGQDDTVIVNRIIMIRKNQKLTIDQRIKDVQDSKTELINSLINETH